MDYRRLGLGLFIVHKAHPTMLYIPTSEWQGGYHGDGDQSQRLGVSQGTQARATGHRSAAEDHSLR